MCMHLSGVQSRARYLLFCFPFMPLATAYLLTLDQWYKATAAIKNKITATNSGDDDSVSKIARPINLVLIWIGNPIIATIIPMIVYDDKFSLNWAYAGSITYQGLVALNIQVVLTVVTYRLLRACTPEGGVEQTDDLKAEVQKVNTSTSNRPRLVAPISPPLPLLPFHCLSRLAQACAVVLGQQYRAARPCLQLLRMDGRDLHRWESRNGGPLLLPVLLPLLLHGGGQHSRTLVCPESIRQPPGIKGQQQWKRQPRELLLG